jgi:rhamnogalacturonyl hydrolase YesR
MGKEKPMRYINLIILILFIGMTGMQAQEKRDAETVIRKIADHILVNTTYKLKDTITGETYESTQGLTWNENIVIDSPYNDWKYWNGVLNLGMMEMGDILGEQKYVDFALKHMEFAFGTASFFEPHYSDQGIWNFPFAMFYVMDQLDCCGAEGASCVEVYKRTGKDEYKAYIDKAANYVLNGQVKLEDGTLVRPWPPAHTLWGDDLYMSVPLLARYGALTGDQRYFDFAALQIKKYREYLYNSYTELYYHCYYVELERNGVAHWGRCNGWVMMAQVNLLSYLPEDHPDRPELLKILNEQIIGISRYQSESGLWHQILNREDSYLETSCSAMFTWSIAKAVNEGWIDNRYLSAAQSGWNGLLTKIREDGQVEDICVGTGIEDNMVFYYKRPTLLNDIHGLGAVLLAGIEMMKLEQKN